MRGASFSLGARECPICNASDQSSLFVESNVDVAKLDAFAFASRKAPEYMHWRLLECERCDVLYASPAPLSGALSVAYEDAAFDSGLEAGYAAKTYGRLLPRIIRKLPSVVGALDIGTGDGAFLDVLLDAGFSEVVGVEPSTAPVASASPRVKPLIRQSVFRVSDFAPGSLRLVTCFQTIEHLYDPLRIAKDVLQLLAPGGAVLFVGHNRRALSAKVLGRRSPIFDIEHLQLFSPKSLRRLIERAGFADVEVGSFLNRYPASYWARLLPFPPAIKKNAIGALNLTRLGEISVVLPAGNLYGIGYKS